MSKDIVIRLIGIGYAGVDFVEAFLAKFINSGSPVAGQGSAPLAPQNGVDFDKGIKAWLPTGFSEVQHIEFGHDEAPPTPRAS